MLKHALKNIRHKGGLDELILLALGLLASIYAVAINDSVHNMYIGLAFVAYAVMGNDSLQSIGTLLSSIKDFYENKHRQHIWRFAFLYLTVFLWATLWIGWYLNSGDIAWGRLNKIPRPEHFTPFHAIAPIILLFLTVGFKFWKIPAIPVSTTFLVLTVFTLGGHSCDVFSGDGCGVFYKMLTKSFVGYALAAVVAALLWWGISYIVNERIRPSESHRSFWIIAQWSATAFLWTQWLTHDMANIAVYMPRNMSAMEVFFALMWLTVCLYYIVVCKKGGNIQKVVQEKYSTGFIRSATIIDLVYALVLYFFKEVNDIPMSTTWVFVGLLAGRQWAIGRFHPNPEKKRESTKQMLFPLAIDFAKIMFGLVVSVILALAAGYWSSYGAQ